MIDYEEQVKWFRLLTLHQQKYIITLFLHELYHPEDEIGNEAYKKIKQGEK